MSFSKSLETAEIEAVSARSDGDNSTIFPYFVGICLYKYISIIFQFKNLQKIIHLFNGEDLKEFTKRPDLLHWFSLLLKQNEIVPGKLLSVDEILKAFLKKVDDKFEISADLETILFDLKCAAQFEKDFVEFLDEEWM